MNSGRNKKQCTTRHPCKDRFCAVRHSMSLELHSTSGKAGSCSQNKKKWPWYEEGCCSTHSGDLDRITLRVATIEGNACLGGVLLELIERSSPVRYQVRIIRVYPRSFCMRQQKVQRLARAQHSSKNISIYIVVETKLQSENITGSIVGSNARSRAGTVHAFPHACEARYI